jgi:phosphopantetheinyl transferase (holo-ACP synthase)
MGSLIGNIVHAAEHAEHLDVNRIHVSLPHAAHYTFAVILAEKIQNTY